MSSDRFVDVLDGLSRAAIIEGKSEEVLEDIVDALGAHGMVDAVVTDPPSGIGFMGLDWDRSHGGRGAWATKVGRVLALARQACVPGARAFVWALPRTTHWTGCAVEDAGWSIENVVTHLFGTGWPKGSSQLKPSSEHWYLARTSRRPASPLSGSADERSRSAHTHPAVT